MPYWSKDQSMMMMMFSDRKIKVRWWWWCFWSKDQNVMMMRSWWWWCHIDRNIRVWWWWRTDRKIRIWWWVDVRVWCSECDNDDVDVLIMFWWCFHDDVSDRKIRVWWWCCCWSKKVQTTEDVVKRCYWSKGQSVEDVAEVVVDRKVKILKMLLIERSK